MPVAASASSSYCRAIARMFAALLLGTLLALLADGYVWWMAWPPDGGIPANTLTVWAGPVAEWGGIDWVPLFVRPVADTIGFIVRACFGLWGFLYLFFLSWMVYRLKREHVRKSHTAWLIVLSHFIFMHIQLTNLFLRSEYRMPDWPVEEYPMRVAVISVVLLLLCLEPFFMSKLRKRATLPGESDPIPQSQGPTT